MTLLEAISAAGMTPPRTLQVGRWVRFPGAGKGRGNSAGWCRMISPTLAVFGDWSTGLTETWRDDAHVDSEESRRLFAEAKQRERQFQAQQRARQQRVASEASELVRKATVQKHHYLTRKGFPEGMGLVHDDMLIVPMRDAREYGLLLTVQQISPTGEKRFLPGGRAGGACFRIGATPREAKHVVLCEGYATGLSIHAALSRLPGPSSVIVCFSAMNMESIAPWFPNARVAADNDASATGERSAERTGLKWTMPYEVGTDFNDLHQNMGIYTVVERMRELIS
jgi:putative DNA primase/helicase